MQAEINGAVNGNSEESRTCRQNACAPEWITGAKTSPDCFEKEEEKPGDEQDADDASARQQFEIIVVRLLRSECAGCLMIRRNGSPVAVKADAR